MKSDIRLREMSFFLYETSCSGFGERFPRLHPGKEEEGVLANHGDVGGKRVGPIHAPSPSTSGGAWFQKKSPPYSDTSIPPDENNHSTIGTRIERAEAKENKEFPAWHRSSDEARIPTNRSSTKHAAGNERQLYLFYVLYSIYL